MFGFIVNPVSANGRTGKWWPEIEKRIRAKLGDGFRVALTKRPLHAVELTGQLLHQGCDSIIAVGGDGTLNEVLNGFYPQLRSLNFQASLGIISLGTGADFIRTIQWPVDPEEAISRILQKKTKNVDIGLIEYTSFSGERTSRYFINIADFGLGAAVADRVNKTTKRFGGKVSFLWGIVATLLSYKNKTMTFRMDNQEWQTQTVNVFIVGNGRFFGGGLNPAPFAEIADGIFDVVVVGDVKFFEAIGNLGRLRKGTHLSHPKVKTFQTKTIEVHSPERVLIELDGETIGTLPVKASILPGAVPLIV